MLGDEFLSPDESREPEMPNTVSFFEPCEVYLDRAFLMGQIQINLTLLQGRVAKLESGHPEMAALEQAIAQRRELLAWLGQHPKDHVYTALYPVSEFEPHEEVED